MPNKRGKNNDRSFSEGSVADKICDLLSSRLRKSNSKLPPSYASPSSNETVTDNFLILNRQSFDYVNLDAL